MNAILEFFKSFFDLFQKTEPIPLKDFATFADLEAWFDLHDELAMPAPNLCDDFTRESRRLAEIDGYHLAPHLVYAGQVYGTMVFKPEDFTDGTNPASVYHIANMAIVTDTQACYYVDLAWKKLIYLCQFIAGGKY